MVECIGIDIINMEKEIIVNYPSNVTNGYWAIKCMAEKLIVKNKSQKLVVAFEIK
ncbi:MAG: hypothetical protein ACJA0H_002413 [Francisellaceae bacterium]|jgi:hypothetical protein